MLVALTTPGARIPPEHLQQLAPLMRMIAVERGEDRFELQLK
ncbi:MAG TPA: hypothetical protein VHE58_10985 [Burkholderiales bacterium]|nr:hypothetical protein [Burkholderiales bacterium]